MNYTAVLLLALVASTMAVSVKKTPQVPVPQDQAKKIDVFCDVCLLLIYELDTFLTEDSTTQEITDFLSGVCTILGPLEGICNKFMETYIPQIIDLLVEQNLAPQDLCGSSGLNICEEEAPPALVGH
eukprot:maker-scaffold541_size141817-snap-gene-0.25 protein:Tk05602 transcript:maker-scaffold541_size141817-snap-gene-0.25-mRNA-1 annotation:"expressed hypothetical protein"